MNGIPHLEHLLVESDSQELGRAPSVDEPLDLLTVLPRYHDRDLGVGIPPGHIDDLTGDFRYVAPVEVQIRRMMRERAGRKAHSDEEKSGVSHSKGPPLVWSL